MNTQDRQRGKAALNKILEGDKLKGFPGIPGGATLVEHHPGFVYVRVQDGIESGYGEAINMGSNLDPAVEVKLVKENGVLVIKEANAIHASAAYGTAAASANHAPGVGVENASPVDGARLLPGACYPSARGGLNVTIHDYPPLGWVTRDFPGGMTASVPGSAGQICWAVLYLSDDGVPDVATSTPVSGVDKDLMLVSSAQAVTLPDGCIRLFAITLKNGQTAVSESRFVDLRDWLTPQGVITTPGGSGTTDYILIREEQGATTQGGGFTSGARRTRVLNTEVTDTGGHASLSGNQITLAAGTYRAHIYAPAFRVDNHQAYLYNVTDAADVLIGQQNYSDAAGDRASNNSIITGRFTIAGTKVFEVQHECETTRGTNGFGNFASFASTNIYTIVELEREP